MNTNKRHALPLILSLSLGMGLCLAVPACGGDDDDDDDGSPKNCGQLTSGESVCMNGVVTSCNNGTTSTMDCTALNDMECEETTGSNGLRSAGCSSKPMCNGLNKGEGKCTDDGMAANCSSEGIYSESDCTRADKKGCAMDQTTGLAYCLQAEAGDKGCGSLTEDGICAGNSIKFCSDNKVKVLDCTAYGDNFTCSNDNADYAYCTMKWIQCSSDTTVTADGSCNGTVVSRCVNTLIKKEDCALSGGTCGPVPGENTNQCIYPDCGDVTAQGKCDGAKLLKCVSGNHLKTTDCDALFGLTCGMKSDGVTATCK